MDLAKFAHVKGELMRLLEIRPWNEGQRKQVRTFLNMLEFREERFAVFQRAVSEFHSHKPDFSDLPETPLRKIAQDFLTRIGTSCNGFAKDTITLKKPGEVIKFPSLRMVRTQEP